MRLRKRRNEEGGHQRLLEKLKNKHRVSRKQLQRRHPLRHPLNLNLDPILRMQNRSPRNDEVDHQHQHENLRTSHREMLQSHL